jgi:hypothetical protein
MKNTLQQHTGQRLPGATCSASLARQIAALETELKPLLDRMATLRRKEREALSREFIAANQITREDVEMSSGHGKPWFGTVYEFGKWLARQSGKVWAEWNGRIYHAADLANGRMPDMPGEVDHLPNAE